MYVSLLLIRMQRWKENYYIDFPICIYIYKTVLMLILEFIILHSFIEALYLLKRSWCNILSEFAPL